MRNAISFTLLAGALFLALAARTSLAQDIAPDALVKSVTLEVIAVIKKNGDAHDPAAIDRLVETRILPHFDFARMTRLAMGRNWRLVSPGQQQALIAQFRTLLPIIDATDNAPARHPTADAGRAQGACLPWTSQHAKRKRCH